MLKNSLVAIGNSARDIFKSPGALALISALYLALLASVYLFFATGVATAWQLVLSAMTAFLAPLLFFVLQAAVANYAQNAVGFGGLLRRALRDFWKVILVSLPLIALAVLVVYLLNKLQNYLPKPDEAAQRVMPMSPVSRTAPPAPMRWQDAFVSSLWLLVLGVILPLMAAHLWLAVARDGLARTLKGTHRVLARAFAPQSVFVYAVGLFVFGLMPYFVLYTRTPVGGAWGELTLFGLRLALAFVFTLWGWTITLGALARTGVEPQPVAVTPAPEELQPQES